MPENHFGEPVAARYDQSSADMFEPAVVDPVVDVLADLAGDGAALELGIGTGRIALPLSQRGVRVRDGARLVLSATRSGTGYVAFNEGQSYTVTPESLVFSIGDDVIREEPLTDVHEPGTSGSSSSTSTTSTSTSSAPTSSTSTSSASAGVPSPSAGPASPRGSGTSCCRTSARARSTRRSGPASRWRRRPRR